jgi:hypothetical protein
MRHQFLAPLYAALVFASFAPGAAAQTEIQRRRAAPAKGTVSIENDFGTLTVRGWERNEVLVQGTLAAGAEGLSLEGEKGETSISVEVPEEWFHAAGEAPAFRSTLTVSVPAGSRLEIQTVNSSVFVEAVAGSIEVRTVNGAVRIDAPATAIEVETMTGTVSVRAPAAEANVHSISGDVLLEGATGRVRVETMSGRVTVVRGAGISELEVETIAGAVEVQGTLARQGKVSIETFSSPVRLILPAALEATFDLQTFSGQIRSQFCAGTPLTNQRFEPFRQLRCSTGGEELEITVRTHDADITIAPAGAN